ncbi:hypothetical protein ACFS07_10885 [Undibacterium arcticum]
MGQRQKKSSPIRKFVLSPSCSTTSREVATRHKGNKATRQQGNKATRQHLAARRAFIPTRVKDLRQYCIYTSAERLLKAIHDGVIFLDPAPKLHATDPAQKKVRPVAGQ